MVRKGALVLVLFSLFLGSHQPGSGKKEKGHPPSAIQMEADSLGGGAQASRGGLLQKATATARALAKAAATVLSTVVTALVKTIALALARLAHALLAALAEGLP